MCDRRSQLLITVDMVSGVFPACNRVSIHFALLFFLLVALYFSIATQPSNDEAKPSILPRENSLPEQQCGFTSNPDILGIGIRIGYYTQAVAVWFANFFLFREAKVLRAVNTLFVLAMFIVSIISACDASNTYAAEMFLLLQIGLCLGTIGMLDISRYSTRLWKISWERLAIKTAMVHAGHSFNVWLWWSGLDNLLETPCGTFMWFVVKADLYGLARTIMKVVSILGLLERTYSVTWRDSIQAIHAWYAKDVREDFKGLSYQKSSGSVVSDATSQPLLKTPEPAANGDEQPSEPPVERVGHPLDPNSIETRAEDVHTTELGPSPPPSLSSGCEPTATGTNPRKSTPTFESIYVADRYLQRITAIYPPTIAEDRRHTCSIFRGRIKFYIPSFQTRCKQPAPSNARCLFLTAKAILCGRLPVGAVAIVILHIVALAKDPAWRFPRFIYEMVRAMPAEQPPDWQSLTLASDIQLSQIPFTVARWKWIYEAAKTLGVLMLFIGQVELTIAWNHMGGVQALTTVGQLIPFILGVGGLVKVLWGKWCLLRDGTKEEACSDEILEGKDAIEAYQTWKKAYEQRIELGLGQ